MVKRAVGFVVGLLASWLVVSATNLDLQASAAPIAAAAIGLFALTLLRPRAGVLLVFGALPLLPVLANLLRGPWIAPAELALLVLVGALGFVTAVDKLPDDVGPIRRLRGPLMVSAGAALVGAVAATIAAAPLTVFPRLLADFGQSFFSLPIDHAATPLRAALVYSVPLLAYLALHRASAGRTRSTLQVLLGGAILVALYAITEAALGLKLWPLERYEESSRYVRVVATLNDYNSAGSFLVLFLFPALGASLRGHRAAWGVSGLLGGALILTGSRAAWVATVVVAVLILGAGLAGSRWRGDPSLRRARMRRAGIASVLPVLAFMVWPGLTGDVMRERAVTLIHPHTVWEALYFGRLSFWTAGGRMVADRPWAGQGPGRVPSRFSDYKEAHFHVEAENLHSYPLQCVAENGVIGGVLLLWPFGALVPLLLATRRAALDGRGDPMVLGLGPGLLAFAISGLAGHPWLLVEMQAVFWGAAAILDREVEGIAGLRLPRRAMTILGTIFLVVWGGGRLATAPGTEIGRFGAGVWRGEGATQWVGPYALISMGDGGPVSLRVRRHREGPPGVRARVVGGEWVEGRAEAGGFWEYLDLPGGAERLVEVVSDDRFCPDQDHLGDRRIISVEASATPPDVP